MCFDGYDVKTRAVFRYNPVSVCGADFVANLTLFATSGVDLVRTGRRNHNVMPSLPGGLDGSADVWRCLTIDMMSKTARYDPTSMCGADFDGFTHPGGVLCTHR